MRGLERIRDLDAEIEELLDCYRLRCDDLPERPAFEALHDDEGAPLVFPDFVDGADIGMVEGGSSAGFAAKAFEGLRFMHQLLGKKFQCDGAAKRSVFGAVDDTHAAAPSFSRMR